MKMKSFAIFATSGLLVGAVSYAVPALADDMSGGQGTQQAAPSEPSASSDSSSQNLGAGTQNNSAMMPSDNTGGTMDNTGASEPDQAPPASDDDY